jgi:hypothetical protein
VREKLVGYSLNMSHEYGGPKARGFELILGITIRDIDYLEAVILDGILVTGVRSVRPNPPFGFNCVVELPCGGGARRTGGSST